MTKGEHERGLVVARIAARFLVEPSAGSLPGPAEIKRAVQTARMIVAEALFREDTQTYADLVAEMEAAKHD